MEIVRTPDDRFVDLPDYDFEPNYAGIDDLDGATLRVHFIDVGPRDAAPVLLMHGEPSWCYLYRHMIPILVAAGYRVVAPDLVGFGRSDKPTSMSDYTYARHVSWMSQLLFENLDLRNITLFGQDWGGLVGLRLVADAPDRFARVAIGNTGLPTGRGKASEAFLKWQQFSQTTKNFPVGWIINGGCVSDLDPAVIAAYDAPFPDDAFKAGARIFPTLVPTSGDDPASADNDAAWEVLAKFDKPFLCAFSDKDAITAGGDDVFKTKVPGASGMPHTVIADGGHFLQEDQGPRLATVIVEFIEATS